jgi:hypothetical protein
MGQFSQHPSRAVLGTACCTVVCGPLPQWAEPDSGPKATLGPSAGPSTHGAWHAQARGDSAARGGTTGRGALHQWPRRTSARTTAREPSAATALTSNAAWLDGSAAPVTWLPPVVSSTTTYGERRGWEQRRPTSKKNAARRHLPVGDGGRVWTARRRHNAQTARQRRGARTVGVVASDSAR